MAGRLVGHFFVCGFFLLSCHINSAAAQPAAETGEVEKCIQHLKGPNSHNRMAACLVLSDLGPKAKRAIPALVDVVQKLGESANIRNAAFDALCQIGPDAVPALMKLLNDPKEDVWQRAFMTLKALGPRAQSAVPGLVEMLKDKDSANRQETIEILGSIGPKAEAAIPMLATILEEEWNGTYALRALVKIGVASVPALITTLAHSTNADARRWAAVALGDIGLPGKDAAIPALTQGLSDRDQSVRAYSAKSLSTFGPFAKNAVRALINTLAEKDTETRKYSALALGKIGPAAKAAAGALTKALDCEDSDVQLEVAYALGQIGPDARSIRALVKVAETGHPWAATQATRTLVLIGPEAKEVLIKQIVPALIKEVKGNDDFSRSQAMLSLMDIGPDAKDAVEAVRAVLKRGKRDEVLEAVGVLGEIGPDAHSAVQDLIEIVTKEIDDELPRDESLEACEIQNEAAWALGRIGKGAKQAAPILRALLARGNSPYFRRRATDALRLIEAELKLPQKNP